MKTALLLLLLSASPSMAAECFHNEDDPTWTVTVNDPGVEPEMLWKQGDKVVKLDSASAGTGISQRYLADQDSDDTYGYVFVDETLVIEHVIYRKGCN